MDEELLEKFWISEGYEKPKEIQMPENVLQRQLWELMEYPDSSLFARIFALLSIFVISTYESPEILLKFFRNYFQIFSVGENEILSAFFLNNLSIVLVQ